MAGFIVLRKGGRCATTFGFFGGPGPSIFRGPSCSSSPNSVETIILTIQKEAVRYLHQ